MIHWSFWEDLPLRLVLYGEGTEGSRSRISGTREGRMSGPRGQDPVKEKVRKTPPVRLTVSRRP